MSVRNIIEYGEVGGDVLSYYEFSTDGSLIPWMFDSIDVLESDWSGEMLFIGGVLNETWSIYICRG